MIIIIVKNGELQTGYIGESKTGEARLIIGSSCAFDTIMVQKGKGQNI